MGNKNKINVNYHYLVFLFFLLTVGCNSNKQIVVDDELKNSSENWKATIKKGTLVIGSSNFGPYRTISATKLDSAKLKTNTNKFWKINIFATNSTTKKRKVYALDVVNNNDEAKVLLYVWFTSQSRKPGLLSIYREEENNEVKDAYGEININSSDDLWSFKINKYGIDAIYSPNYILTKTSGYLIHKNDTINITSATEYTNGKPGFGHVLTKGIILFHKEEAFAALQLLEENYVWIRKDLPSDTQLAIAGLFSAILGTKDL